MCPSDTGLDTLKLLLAAKADVNRPLIVQIIKGTIPSARQASDVVVLPSLPEDGPVFQFGHGSGGNEIKGQSPGETVIVPFVKLLQRYCEGGEHTSVGQSVQLLLANKADVNAVTPDRQRTPLFVAI